MSWALCQTTLIFEELVIFGVQLFGGWKVKKLDSQPTSYASSLMILVVWNPRGRPRCPSWVETIFLDFWDPPLRWCLGKCPIL